MNNGWASDVISTCAICGKTISGYGLCNGCWKEHTATGTCTPIWLSAIVSMHMKFERSYANWEVQIPLTFQRKLE